MLSQKFISSLLHNKNASDSNVKNIPCLPLFLQPSRKRKTKSFSPDYIHLEKKLSHRCICQTSNEAYIVSASSLFRLYGARKTK
jgi:hypothetical protein